jgi:MoaA/NifB/PqqE/SkfB family radical SAM enzyme
MVQNIDVSPGSETTRTLEKRLTRRGVVWLGQTCNLRCRFCYFIDRVADVSHPEHSFMPLDKAKKICRTLVDFYGNNAVDLQGGEPTLYKDIFELVTFCNEIGLVPTLITNGLLLDKRESCERYREAGVRDFLISVQGLGDVHDYLVGYPGAHRRQMGAIENLRSLGIPFRFNVVMTKPALPQLPDIARLAINSGALVVNFITFNPFADQSRGGHRNGENVPRYSEVRPHLTEAFDLLEAVGIEANVRYFPFCMVEERHRKNVYNFQQLSYDPYEWDFASWGWTGLEPQRTAAGDVTPPVALIASRTLGKIREPLKKLGENPLLRPVLYGMHGFLTRLRIKEPNQADLYRRVARMHAEVYCGYSYGEKCGECSLKLICDGFHGDYAVLFDLIEARPVTAAEISDDPLQYICMQNKLRML